MSSYRETTNAAKAARRGLVDQRPVGGRPSRAKHVEVEARIKPGAVALQWHKNRFADWRKWRAYENERVALEAMARFARTYDYYEFRIKPT